MLNTNCKYSRSRKGEPSLTKSLKPDTQPKENNEVMESEISEKTLLN